jgi:CHAT domain-containing protein
MKYFVPRRFVALAGCAFALVCAPLQHAAYAQETTPAPSTNSTETPRLSDGEARAAWQTKDAERLSFPLPSEKRAEAAEAMATLSAQIAWTAFDAKQWDDAATWFARRAEARRDSYDNRRALYEKLYQTLNQQLTDGQKGTKAAWTALQKKHPQRHKAVVAALRQKKLSTEPIEFSSSLATQNALIEIGKSVRGEREKAVKAKNPKLAQRLFEQHQQLVAIQTQMAQANMARSQRATILSGLQILARDIRRYSDLLRFAEWDYNIRKQDLADWRAAGLPEDKIHTQIAYLATAMETLAGAREDMALYDEAIATYRASLALRQTLPADHLDRELNKPLFSLGRLQQRLGNLAEARDNYQQALAHVEKNASARMVKVQEDDNVQSRLLSSFLETMNQIVLLNNLGTLVSDMGDFKGGYAFIERAQKQVESLSGEGYLARFRTSLLATTLGNLATIQADSGDTSKALDAYNRVIQMRREIGEDEQTAVALMNAAGILWQDENKEQAKAYVEQARRLYTTTQDLRGISATTNFLATIARESDQLDEAAQYSEEALVIARKTGDLDWVASATRNLAQIRWAQKRPDEALKLLEEVAALNTRIGSPLETKRTFDLQAQILEEQGQSEAALAKYQAAITLLESVRANAHDESTFNQSNYGVYGRLVKLLIKLDRGADAVDYLNRARSKELQDKIKVEDLPTANPKLRQLFRESGMLKNRLRSAQAELRSEQARPEAERDTVKVNRLRQIIASTPGEFHKLSLNIRKANSNFDKIMTLQPTQLREVQRNIPEDTVLVQYAPLGEQLYIFVVTNKQLKIVAMPVPPDELWKTVDNFRNLIKTSQQDFESGTNLTVEDWSKQINLAPLRDNLTALYDMLIAPIEEELAGKKTLAFVPTQSLYYLPLHALAKQDGDKLRFLIEDKQVVYLAAADVFKVFALRDAEKLGNGLMAIGNPDGADLPEALTEAQNIAKVFSPSQVLSGTEATKNSVLEPDNLNKRIWHFATHGHLNASSPEQSYIQLAKTKPTKETEKAKETESAQLSIGEVWELDLSKLDLVTLSACQTALGDTSPTGGDLTSLAESFSSAGAASVVASLWSVADNSTSALMSEFYKNLAAGQPKAQALQNAQLKLIQNPEYAHPFYWAPFILMGDWR